MRIFRLIILAVLFAVVLVGCVTFADAYSDQNPRNVTPLQTATAETTAEPTPTTAPDLTAPTLSASQTGANEATISWSAVTDADGYQLEWQDDATPWGPIGGVVTRTETSVVLTGLPIAKTFEYRVRAVAGDGSDKDGYISGPWSAVVSITLAAPTPTPTPAPTPTP